jgi:hypothetical protein
MSFTDAQESNNYACQIFFGRSRSHSILDLLPTACLLAGRAIRREVDRRTNLFAFAFVLRYVCVLGCAGQAAALVRYSSAVTLAGILVFCC